MKRAVAAAFGWPANLPEDAVYPYTQVDSTGAPVSYTHLRAHETVLDLVCRLLLEKKKNKHDT